MSNDEKRMELINQAVDDFGGLLREYRKENFLTLQCMAEVIGCSPSYVYRIENKKRNPEVDFRVKALSEGMNWSEEDIYLYLKEILSREKRNKTE